SLSAKATNEIPSWRVLKPKVKRISPLVMSNPAPAASGAALKGHKEAGDARFGALWSLLHLPSVSFPIGKGRSDLRLVVQYVGAYGRDMHTLSAAQFIAQALSS